MIFRLTDAGRLFEAQLVAGSKPIITRIEAGDTYSASPDSLLSVQSKKQNLQLGDISVIDGKTHLKFLLTNLEIASEYYLRQIGIYAKQSVDGAEILYIVGQDKNGERVPAISDREVEYEYDLIISVDNSYEVTLNISGNDFVRRSTLELILEDLVKGKADVNGGDIGQMVASFDDSGTVEGITSFTDFLKTFVTGTSVYKLLTNLGAGLRYVLHVGQLVNDCVTDRSDLPLAAAQGKTLMDLCTQLNSDLAGLSNSKNSKITLSEYNNNFIVSPTTWSAAFNLWLTPGLYIVKHSAFAINGVSGLSLSMAITGVIDEQQTDRSTDNNKGVRGVIGSTIYYLPSGGAYIGNIYVDHSTTATVNNNLKLLKLW